MKASFILPVSRTRTSLLALFLSLPVLTAPLASAFSGGNGSPFSNGTFFPNDGSFQTTIRGVNLSGVATFSTTAGSSNSTSSNSTASGSFTVTYQGKSYTGNVDASMDSASGNIAATMEASISRGGNGTATTIVDSVYQATGNYTTVNGGTTTVLVPEVATTILSGGQTNVLVPTITTTVVPGGSTNVLVPVTTTLAGPQSMVSDVNGNGHVINSAETTVLTPNGASQVVTLPSTTVTSTNDVSQLISLPDTALTATNMVGVTNALPDSLVANYKWLDEVAKSTYMDTLYSSGSFTAKLKNSYPNQIFKGKGTMSFTAINFTLVPPALETTKVAISVKGSRIADTAQSYTSQTVQAPSILTTISLQNRTN